LSLASGLREAGFAATYVFAKDITEPEKIIGLLGSAVPELGLAARPGTLRSGAPAKEYGAGAPEQPAD
jgi:hypothetical protein